MICASVNLKFRKPNTGAARSSTRTLAKQVSRKPVRGRTDRPRPRAAAGSRRAVRTLQEGRGDFVYDVDIYEAAQPANAGGFYAQVVKWCDWSPVRPWGSALNFKMRMARHPSLSLADMDEMASLQRRILRSSALIDQLLIGEKFQGGARTNSATGLAGISRSETRWLN